MIAAATAGEHERESSMKVTVNADLCVGTGSCEGVCPQVFKVNASGIAEVQVTPVPAELEDSAREAAASCPVDAITVED